MRVRSLKPDGFDTLVFAQNRTSAEQARIHENSVERCRIAAVRAPGDVETVLKWRDEARQRCGLSGSRLYYGRHIPNRSSAGHFLRPSFHADFPARVSRAVNPDHGGYSCCPRGSGRHSKGTRPMRFASIPAFAATYALALHVASSLPAAPAARLHAYSSHARACARSRSAPSGRASSVGVSWRRACTGRDAGKLALAAPS